MRAGKEDIGSTVKRKNLGTTDRQTQSFWGNALDIRTFWLVCWRAQNNALPEARTSNGLLSLFFSAPCLALTGAGEKREKNLSEIPDRNGRLTKQGDGPFSPRVTTQMDAVATAGVLVETLSSSVCLLMILRREGCLGHDLMR